MVSEAAAPGPLTETLVLHVCVDYPEFSRPDTQVHEVFSTCDASPYSEEHSLVLQTSTRGHTSEWKLLHPASSAEPVLSLTLGRSMAVHQGGGGPATQLRKAKMFSSKRLFEHGGRQFCWRRERLDERHEKFRLVLTLEDGTGAAKVPRGQRSVVAEVRSAQPQVSTLQVYELGSLPVPLLVMTAMVMDFERRQATAPAPFAKASLAATT